MSAPPSPSVLPFLARAAAVAATGDPAGLPPSAWFDAHTHIGQNDPDGQTATADQIAFERGRFARAPLVVAVVSRAAPHAKIPEWEQQLSAGAACMNLVTAAHALGYVAIWLTEWLAYDRAAMTALGLADQERIAGFVYVGHTAKPPEDRERPSLDKIVTYFQGAGR